MTAAQDFMRSPEQFMRSNIVFTTGMGGQRLKHDSLFWVTLVAGWAPEPIPPYAAKPANGTMEATGNACSVYFLKSLGLCRPVMTPPDDSFVVYWVPYKEDGAPFTNIGTRSPIIFTAKMDGCSFGLGTVNPDGSCIAGHANRKTLGGASGFRAQATQQAADLTRKGMPHQIGPDTYRDPVHDAGGTQTGWAGQGTTFGLRSDIGWKIFTQRIGGSQPNFVHKGVVTGITAQF